MVWRRLLLLIGLTGLMTATFVVPASVAASTTCSQADKLADLCPDISAEVTDNGVQLTGTKTLPGDGAVPGAPFRTDDDSVSVDNPGTGAQNNSQSPRDGYTVSAPITLADLVGFRPSPGTDQMEPNGWMVVGLDTNFYAVVATQVQNGQLLGETASVRFTPKRFRWNYGDGSSATRTTRGATWAAQGITEFDPTPTSHVYLRGGTYSIDLTIDFGAEYRYGAGAWIPIAGTIAVPANRLVATAGDAKTVLVAKDCSANPSGPGC